MDGLGIEIRERKRLSEIQSQEREMRLHRKRETSREIVEDEKIVILGMKQKRNSGYDIEIMMSRRRREKSRKMVFHEIVNKSI